MIETDPKALPDSAWADDVQQWPKIDDGKLFSYILGIKAVDVNYIGKYKDQKAYSYWTSGFVDTVFVAKCPSNIKLIFLKGKVSPSQRLNKDPHEVWVCIENSNTDCRIVTLLKQKPHSEVDDIPHFVRLLRVGRELLM